MDVKFFVRFMDSDGQFHKQVYYELSQAIKRFDEVIKNNPKFADLDIVTTVNAKTFESN